MLHSVSSPDLYALTLPAHPWVQKGGEVEPLYDLFLEKSFKTQIADNKLPSTTVRARVLAGTLQPLEFKAPPKPFKGTCSDLTKTISGIVHETVNSLDYNGFYALLKLVEQLKKGKSFREVEIDGDSELFGSTCTGMCLTIAQNLPKGIEGALGVERKVPLGAPGHGVLIFECTDGFVMVDPRSDPRSRIFEIPFSSTFQGKGFWIKAKAAGSSIPLTRGGSQDSFEYCTHTGNGIDLIRKHTIMERLTEYTPLAFYNPDGSAHKSIKLYPSEAKIVLTNHRTRKTETIFFEAIRNGALLPKLETFMAPNYVFSTVPTFHTPIAIAHNQIAALASQEKELHQLLTTLS